jgi:hypothetical protein
MKHIARLREEYIHANNVQDLGNLYFRPSSNNQQESGVADAKQGGVLPQ